jgi:chemosensory pili system protein ChpA (sensor histidine kinase/response regulator)
MVGEKILIVDDDPDIRDVLTLILEAQGYQVTLARDGIECFDKLSKEKPDLMILDLLMPRMDGFAVYKEIQNAKWAGYKNMPILILTSVREEASRRRYELETGQTLNVDRYIEKPVSPEVLINTVAKLINKRKQQ